MDLSDLCDLIFESYSMIFIGYQDLKFLENKSLKESKTWMNSYLCSSFLPHKCLSQHDLDPASSAYMINTPECWTISHANAELSRTF